LIRFAAELDPFGIAMIGEGGHARVHDAEPGFDPLKQHRPGVGSEAPAIKRGNDLAGTVGLKEQALLVTLRHDETASCACCELPASQHLTQTQAASPLLVVRNPG
jgi:hypothetical protein